MAKVKMRIRLLVREIAESKGLDRAKLARKADLTYETVFKLWNEPHRDITLATLVKLSIALSVPIDALYEIEAE